MRAFHRFTLLIAGCLLFNFTAQAGFFLPITADEQIQSSDAIFRGEVLSLHSFVDTNDNHIYTTAAIQVDEIFKGKLPPVEKLVHAGGTVGHVCEMNDVVPLLKAGEERLFFVSRSGNGTLSTVRGDASAFLLPSAATRESNPEVAAGETWLIQLHKQTATGVLPGSDVTDQAATPEETTPTPPGNFIPFGLPVVFATNLLVGSDGIPARFVLPDRGEPIPYLIDADYLPTGITTNEALTAVQTALAAWTNVTSLKYTFLGFQSFGQPATNINNGDGILRIQLHDHYGSINSGGSSGDTLGVGGHVWTVNTLPIGWTTGGDVNGTDFHKVVNGYIELANTNTEMQTLSLFTEVLCHEIGHTFGMAHSSNNQNETNTLLTQAIMFFLAHGDGRGATLGAYDPPVARQVHPTNNTPPYMYDRLIDVVTSPTRPITTPGVNAIQLRGYDLQTTNLTLATTGATSNAGTFSLVSNTLTFVPNNFYSDSPPIDPTTGSYYDLIYARCSDGTNAAPFSLIRVAVLYADSYSEGVPDSWRMTYFGNANPSTGANHHATNDADGDGYNNLTEFQLGSSPVDKKSNLRITTFGTTNLQWQAKPYEVYEILGTTNINNPNWVRVTNPIIPITTNGIATAFTNGGPRQFFRIEKVP